MTAVMTEAPKTGEATLENLRARAGELEAKVENLRTSLADSRRRLESLTAERGSLVLPARSGKDASAQKRLYAIDEQLAVLRRDVADDGEALSELSIHLGSAQNELERAEWERDRDAVRKLLTARIEGKTAAKLEKVANEFAEALKAAAKEDESIAAALVTFEATLHGEAGDVRRRTRHRAQILSVKFVNLLCIDTTQARPSQLHGRDIREEDPVPFRAALEALDRLELVF
jgi:chromosome segregation ATPase